MGMEMGLMAVVMVVVAVIVAGGLVAGVYLGVRAFRSQRSAVDDSPRGLLDRRLAAGEISPEEYYERESALRSGEPLQATRGR